MERYCATDQSPERAVVPKEKEEGFNGLPQSVKNLSDNPKQFKSDFKNYLHAHSFYSTEA